MAEFESERRTGLFRGYSNAWAMAEKQRQSTSPAQTEVITEFTTPIIKLVLALLGLFVLQFILTNLPGLDTTFPTTTLTVAAVANAIITLIMAVIIVNFAQEVEPRIRHVITGPEEVVHDVANAVKHLVVFVAVLIVYNGLDDVAIPALVPATDAWMYDMLFLGIALIPTIVVGYRIFDNLDDMAELLTSQMRNVTTTSQLTCTKCGESVDDSLEYCPDCGTALQDTTGAEAETDGEEPLDAEEPVLIACPECEAEIEDTNEFCGHCGTELPQ